MTDKATISVAEMAKALGVSNPVAYAIVHTDGFPAMRIGRRIRIPVSAFEAWMEEHKGSRIEYEL